MKRRAGVLAGLIAAAGIVTAAVYRYIFFFSRRQRKHIGYPEGEQYTGYRRLSEGLIQRLKEIPFEEVKICSDDGLDLYGKYYHQAEKAPVEILFHGYHGVAERDFCGGFWLAREAGHNVLLIDERAHGKSDGHVISFGIRERYDCLAWIRYITERCGRDVPIVLVGVSMGAATVLMTSNLDLPDNVKGIIADCGYSSAKAIIKKRIGEMGLPVGFLYPVVRVGARIFGHFDLEESSPVEALRECNIPVLLIHGEDDRFVPCEMSWENYRACGAEKDIFTVPGAGHALCYMADTEGYRKVVREFLDKIGITIRVRQEACGQ